MYKTMTQTQKSSGSAYNNLAVITFLRVKKQKAACPLACQRGDWTNLICDILTQQSFWWMDLEFRDIPFRTGHLFIYEPGS